MRWSRAVLDQYFADGGDQKFRLDHYKIHQGLIIEIGACDGDFTEKLAAKFPHSSIIAVEPVRTNFEAAEKRLAHLPNVVLTNLGLWTFDGSVHMTDDGAASAVAYIPERESKQVHMYDVGRYLKSLGDIALVIMNTEGSEYTLLPEIIFSKAITKIQDLQIQFHDTFDEASEVMADIQARLAATHHLTYQYPFVMENWRRS